MEDRLVPLAAIRSCGRDCIECARSGARARGRTGARVTRDCPVDGNHRARTRYERALRKITARARDAAAHLDDAMALGRQPSASSKAYARSSVLRAGLACPRWLARTNHAPPQRISVLGVEPGHPVVRPERSRRRRPRWARYRCPTAPTGAPIVKSPR